MNAGFQPVPFDLGELHLVLTPAFSREDLEWLGAFRPGEPLSDKEYSRLAFRILDLAFRCARANMPNLKLEDVFAEFGGNPKRYAPALAVALLQLACAVMENREPQCLTN